MGSADRPASQVAQVSAQALSAMGKQAGRGIWALLKKLFRTIGPYYTAMALGVLAIIFLVLLLVMAIYGAMTGYGLTTGITPSQSDAANIAAYTSLANKWNVADAYVVPVASWMFIGANETPKLPGTTLYPGKGDKLSQLDDPNGSDKALELEWGLIHAVRLWWSLKNNNNAVLDSLQNMTSGASLDSVEGNVPADVKADAVADALHPYFYYVTRTWTTRTVLKNPPKNGPSSYTDTEQVHLLVEAQTIQGWYQYFYTNTTTVTDTPNATVTRTYDQLDDTLLVNPDKWERFRTYLIGLYQMQPDQNADLMREFVSEAGTGFTQRQQLVAWLLATFNPTVVGSIVMVPPDLYGYFLEAQQKYGIPWWFLAAVAYEESGFDPTAENAQAGCYGLMQFGSSEWTTYAAQVLGTNDPSIIAEYKDDPRTQIMAGADYLSVLFQQYGGVDWSSDNWEEQTLDALTFYGGFRTSSGGLDTATCEADYASPIWALANGYAAHSITTWPVPDPPVITEKFNSTDNGVSIAASPGDNVTSISGGYVKEIGSDYVVISDTVHDYKYDGLGAVAVTQGQPVEAGITIIGSMPATGNASLFFQVTDDMDNQYINPVTLLPNDWAYSP